MNKVETYNRKIKYHTTLITGYDAGETQTLKNVAGVLTWVTD